MTDRPRRLQTGALRKRGGGDPVARLFAAAAGHARDGRPDEAEALFRRILAADPGNAEAQNNLGSVLDARGRYDAAVTAYGRVLLLFGDHPAVHYNLGSSLHRGGRHGESARHLRRALALAPDYADAHNNLGNLLRHTDVDGAIASYRRAAACDPDRSMPHDNLANLLYLLHEEGRPERAAHLATLWLRDHPDQPLARHTAAALAGMGHEERAADGYVRQLFDHFAREFEGTLEGLEYRAPALLAAAVQRELASASASAGLDVLDAGCGTGLCAPFLRPLSRRLVGVDLSAGMLALARDRALYDALAQAELGAFLEEHPAAYDLIVAADVLCYFGPLSAVLGQAGRALRPGGLLAFTVERLDDAVTAGHRLNPHGRYAHSAAHVRRALADAGLTASGMEEETLRRESGRPVRGLVVVARRGGGQG